MAIIAGVCYSMTSSVGLKYKKKQKVYDLGHREIRQTMDLQLKVAQNAEKLKEWDTMMRTETRGTFLEHWKTAEKNFKGKELTKSSHNWTNYSQGLGLGVQQPASQVNMKFTATFRAMQLALMEMETILPNMQLDFIKMTPDDSGNAIHFDTTFTVWTLK
ncbi:MAG: hypothetical protein KJO21_01395 [Verrucomicrobiae bacterium]|nr:hypothetical protein [Verrucomicrobiae bacterium]